MAKETRVSALISQTTSELLEKQVRATGVMEGHLVEQALRHHLQALQALPADVFTPSTLVVTPESGRAIAKQVESGEPTEALRALLRDGD